MYCMEGITTLLGGYLIDSVATNLMCKTAVWALEWFIEHTIISYESLNVSNH